MDGELHLNIKANIKKEKKMVGEFMKIQIKMELLEYFIKDIGKMAFSMELVL